VQSVKDGKMKSDKNNIAINSLKNTIFLLQRDLEVTENVIKDRRRRNEGIDREYAINSTIINEKTKLLVKIRDQIKSVEQAIKLLQ